MTLIQMVADVLWRILEPRIQSEVTNRILAFSDVLVERGQIPPYHPPEHDRPKPQLVR